jgi:hypothetical protein
MCVCEGGGRDWQLPKCTRNACVCTRVCAVRVRVCVVRVRGACACACVRVRVRVRAHSLDQRPHLVVGECKVQLGEVARRFRALNLLGPQGCVEGGGRGRRGGWGGRVSEATWSWGGSTSQRPPPLPPPAKGHARLCATKQPHRAPGRYRHTLSTALA